MNYKKKVSVASLIEFLIMVFMWVVLIKDYFSSAKIKDYSVFSTKLFGTAGAYTNTDRMFNFFITILFLIGLYLVNNNGSSCLLIRMGKENYVFREAKIIAAYCFIVAVIYVGINYVGMLFICDYSMLKECKFTLLNLLYLVTVFFYFLVCATLTNFLKYLFSFEKIYVLASIAVIIFPAELHTIGMTKYIMISYFDYINEWLYDFKFDWGTYVIHCVISVLFAMAFVYGSVLIFKRRDLLTDEEA